MANDGDEKKRISKGKVIAIVVVVIIILAAISQCAGNGAKSETSQTSATTQEQNTEQQKVEEPSWDAKEGLFGRTIENAWDVAEANGYTPTFVTSGSAAQAFPEENRHSSTAKTWRVGVVKDVDEKSKTVTCVTYNDDQFVEKFTAEAKVD